MAFLGKLVGNSINGFIETRRIVRKQISTVIGVDIDVDNSPLKITKKLVPTPIIKIAENAINTLTEQSGMFDGGMKNNPISQLIDLIKTIINGLKDVFSGIGDMVGSIPHFMDKIGNTLSGVPKIVTTLLNTFKGVVNTVGGTATNLSGSVERIITAVYKGFESIPTTIESVRKNAPALIQQFGKFSTILLTNFEVFLSVVGGGAAGWFAGTMWGGFIDGVVGVPLGAFMGYEVRDQLFYNPEHLFVKAIKIIVPIGGAFLGHAIAAELAMDQNMQVVGTAIGGFIGWYGRRAIVEEVGYEQESIKPMMQARKHRSIMNTYISKYNK